jgi:hypothetical protein
MRHILRFFKETVEPLYYIALIQKLRELEGPVLFHPHYLLRHPYPA